LICISMFIRSHLLRSFLVTLLFILLAAPAPAASDEQRAVMRIDYPEFWPFFVRNQSGRMIGFFHDIVSSALGEMGIDTVWKAFPWERCQANVRNGVADAMITVPTAERLEYAATHADPFYNKELVVFTYAGNPKLPAIESIRTIDDILSQNLTVITYAGNGWSERNLSARGISVLTTPILPNIWRMLAHKRGDIVIEWPGAAWPDIRRVGVTDAVVQTSVTLESMPFHLLIRKGSPYADRLDEFNRIISRMRDDGSIERIVDVYLPLGP